MKKALITMTALALLGANVPRAKAGDRGWAVAGRVMAGVGAGVLLAKALEPQPIYAATPVYVAPAPVVVQQAAPVVVQQVQQPVYVQQPVQTVTLAQQPVYVQQPVVVQPAPVVYAPSVVYPAPVYVRPVCAPPVVSFGISFGHGHYRHHGYGRHW
jgi:hypothetical protein